MPVCPRCDRPVLDTAINCPHCNLALKAHGHPGIPLHRAEGDTFLCASCAYEADNSCTFPKRPRATTCTLYQNVSAPAELSAREIYRIPWWRKLNRFWLAIALLMAISLLTVVL